MAFINISFGASKELIHLLIKQNKQIMAKIDEVQQAVADLQAVVDAKQQAIAEAIAALEAQLADGATPEQLQGVIDSLKAVSDDVDSTPTA